MEGTHETDDPTASSVSLSPACISSGYRSCSSVLQTRLQPVTFPMPSDTNELMDSPTVAGTFGLLEKDEGIGDEQTEGMHEVVDQSGSSGIDKNCGKERAR